MSCGNFTSETLDWSGCDRCECLSSIQLTFGKGNETKPFLRRSLISRQSYRAISLDSNGLRNDSQRSHALNKIRHCLIIISIICSCLSLSPLSRIAQSAGDKTKLLLFRLHSKNWINERYKCRSNNQTQTLASIQTHRNVYFRTWRYPWRC